MKINSILSLAAVSALALIASGALTSAQAREHRAGNVTRTSTWTTARGTGTHTYQRTVDPATKSVTINASTRLPDGRTASRSILFVKTATGREATGQVTGFNGRTVDPEVDHDKDPDRLQSQHGHAGSGRPHGVHRRRRESAERNDDARGHPHGSERRNRDKDRTVTRTVEPPPAG